MPGRSKKGRSLGNAEDIGRQTRAYEAAGAKHLVYDLRFRYADWYEQIDLLGKKVYPPSRLRGKSRFDQNSLL